MKHLIFAFLVILAVGCAQDEPTNQDLQIRIEIVDSISRKYDDIMDKRFVATRDSMRTEIKSLKASIDSLKTTRRESKFGRFVGTVVKYAK